MQQNPKSPMRWVETTTTSPRRKAAPQAEKALSAINIPLTYSTHEDDASNRAGILLYSPRAKTSYIPVENKTTGTATTSKAAAALSTPAFAAAGVGVVDEGFAQNSCSDSVNFANRINASPYKVQTQISTICYESYEEEQTFHVTQQPCEPITTVVGRLVLGTKTARVKPQIPSPPLSFTSHSNETSPVLSSAEYRKRKNERDEEIREIVKMLNDIQTDKVLLTDNEETISPQKSEKLTPLQAGVDHQKTDNIENIPKNDDDDIQLLAELDKHESQTKPTATPSITAAAVDDIRTKSTTPKSILNTQYERSKTDIHLLSTKAATTRRTRNPVREEQRNKRSKSTQPPATKSSELLPENMQRKHHPTYDREAARRFMEEQRKKRRIIAAIELTNRSHQTDKEQIKKRLEELSKYSKKVVTKNLKNAKKRNPSTNLNEVSPSKTARMEIIFKRPVDRRSLNRTKNMWIKKPDQKRHGTKIDENIPVGNVFIPDSASKTKALPIALQENQKRIGLLRKPEIKDHSFSAIKDFSFDKENVAIEMMTPKIDPTRIKTKLTAPPSNQNIVDESKKDEHELQLQMPSARLRPQTATREMNVQVQETTSLMATELKDSNLPKGEKAELPKRDHIEVNAKDADKQAENMSKPAEKILNESTDTLPYWLRPSAVQIYPYNFIMAVRRKLEAIASPPTIIKTTEEHKNKHTSTRSLDADIRNEKTSRLFISKERIADAQQKVKRNIISPVVEVSSEDSSATHSIDDNKNTFEKNSSKRKPTTIQQENENPKSRSLSDLTSNFSSISLQLPVSNTASEVSSIKTESLQKEKAKVRSTVSRLVTRPTEDDDTTTISSSVFNSPVKKLSQKQEAPFEFVAPRPVSPLSLENIDNLKINSNGKLNEAIVKKYVATERGGNSLRNQHIKQKAASVQDTESVNINFNRLLDDFNRSLSQVIEVNEQLKSTLDKSQQICADRTKRKDNKSEGKHGTDEYSSDFEGSSVKLNTNERIIKERAVEMEKSLKHRKKELFNIKNAVKPLISSSQTLTKSTNNKDKSSNLNLNLESADSCSTISTQTKTILSAQSFAQSTSQLQLSDEAELGSLHSESSLDKRLHNIEQLKLNLKQSILNSQTNRKKIDDQSKLSSSEENEKHNSQSKGTHKDKAQNEICRNQSKETQKDKAQNLKDTSQATKKELLDKKSKTFQIIPQKVYTDENVCAKQTDEVVAQQTPEVSVLNTIATEGNSMETTLNISNSIESKTFVVNSTEHSVQTPNRKSTDQESKTITEELQYEADTPSKNNNSGHFAENTLNEGSRRYSHNSKIKFDILQNSSTSSHSTPIKSLHEDYIKSHINSERGDFVSPSDFIDVKLNEISQQAVKEAAATIEGDFMPDSSTDSAAPPSYNALPNKHRITPAKMKTPIKTSTTTTTTFGKEIVTMFNQSDLELSIISSQNRSLSETSLNYSSVGMYEKLIKNETTKSEHLTALLKMREKALIDRTKGQIAWLEVQKEHYKAKGLLMQISAIKKKQRGILLKMEREREGIKRLLQSTTTSTTTSAHSSAQPQFIEYHTSSTRKRDSSIPHPSTAPPVLLPLPLIPKSARSFSSPTQKQNQLQQTIATKSVHSAPIVRANYDLESNRSLEELLRKREDDLRRRREHVERLMQWHHRLDQEEAEVLQLERMLLNYNNVQALPQRHDSKTNEQAPNSKKTKQLGAKSNEKATSYKKRRSGTREEKMERRLKEIDKSLLDLSSISTSNNSTNITATSEDSSHIACDNNDFVRTTGNKLNKLWRRLTSQQVEKFESNCRYKLRKTDLERLYEEAKLAVLRDFTQDEEHRIAVELLDKTATTLSSSQSSQIELGNANCVTIPHLNLNFSSGQSEQEDIDALVVKEETLLDENSIVEKIADIKPSLFSTQMRHDNYSPSTAEGNFARYIEKGIEEEEVSSKPSTTTIAPNSYTSSNSSTSFDSGSGNSFVSLQKVDREELIQRNVQKFLALTQRFNSTQNCEGLERSLSDTQLADNGVGVKKSTKNAANTTQRNIAYYGVKTQKKPSKTVNVEIANSLSSASSLFSGNANTLGCVENLTTQSIRHPSEVVNGNPIISNTSITTLVDSPVSIAVSSHSNSKASDQQKTENSVEIIYSASSESKSVFSSTESSSTSIATQSLSAPEILSNAKQTPSCTSASKSILSAQSGNNNTDVNSTASEITAKLEEISAAVSMLSRSNSLQCDDSNSMSSLQQQKSTNLIPSVCSSLTVNSNFDGQIESNLSAVLSSPSSSYSSNFENIDTDIQSPNNGCTLKSSIVSRNSNSSVQSSSASQILDTGGNTITQSFLENRIIDKYESDFEDEDETRIDDISLPQFESTFETTQDELNDSIVDIEKPEQIASTEKLPTIPVPTKNQVKKSIVDRENLPPPPPPPPPPTSPSTQVKANTSTATATGLVNKSSPQQQLTPDVINELEYKRYQQIQQYEHVTAAVPYMYMREIPNKPPPPYVPPAHGSPMTTIFPSEDRIKDITYRRTHELYCKIFKTDYTNDKGEKLPSVMDEKITNIYERIILDICREYLDEHKEALTKSDPTTFHSNLAFFNPPDRLRCIQKFVYKEVRRCLAMDKNQPKRKQVYSVYGQRAKRDHIGTIIIQEMYDEDDKWCNFHREENEVLDLIIEEMMNKLVKKYAKEVIIEEGGIIEEEEEGEEEENVEVAIDVDVNEEIQTQQTHGEDESLQSLAEEITAAVSINVTGKSISLAQSTVREAKKGSNNINNNNEKL